MIFCSSIVTMDLTFDCTVLWSLRLQVTSMNISLLICYLIFEFELDIDIAKWPINRTYHIPNRHSIGHNTHPNSVAQSRIPARRVIVQRYRSRNCVPPLVQILILPDPPCTIDLSMMYPESRITRRGEQVSRWVAAIGEVSSLLFNRLATAGSA